MSHGSVSTLVLNRVDAARNMARFYAMSIEPTLFGGRSLVRNSGRTGTKRAGDVPSKAPSRRPLLTIDQLHVNASGPPKKT
jgi:WGR domain